MNHATSTNHPVSSPEKTAASILDPAYLLQVLRTRPLQLNDIPAGSTGIVCSGSSDSTVREHYESAPDVWRTICELDRCGQRETAWLYAPGREPWTESDPYPDWILTIDDDGDAVIEVA